MSRVLYNKYRSTNFDQLVGQEHITGILKNAVNTGRVSHSYLFVGSRGTGKTSTARILAKALNCSHLSKDGNPCDECENCVAIAQGKYLDLIEIDAASNRGIDQIRELKEKLEFSPVKGKYKIYIVDEVHMLTKEAFNALLKTLEEPPEHVIFILATTDVHKLPQTILSRCQRYDFRLGTDKQIKQTLEKVAKSEGYILSGEALDLLVDSAKGSYRDSLSLLDAVITGQLESNKPESINIDEVRKVLGIPDNSIVYNFLSAVFGSDGVVALEIVEEIESRGVNVAQFVKACLEVLQSILVSKIRGTDLDERCAFAINIDANRITSVINIFLNADKNLKNSPIPSLVLDMLIVQIASGNVIDEKPKNVQTNSDQNNKEKENEVREEQEEEEFEPVQSSSINVNLTTSQIEEKWKEIVDNLRPVKGRLFAFLSNAKIVELKQDNLKLEVPFQFYKEQIESSSNREIINSVFNKVFGTGFKISCEVNGQAKRKKIASADIVMASIPPKNENRSKMTGFTKPRGVIPKVEQIFEGM